MLEIDWVGPGKAVGPVVGRSAGGRARAPGRDGGRPVSGGIGGSDPAGFQEVGTAWEKWRSGAQNWC